MPERFHLVGPLVSPLDFVYRIRSLEETSVRHDSSGDQRLTMTSFDRAQNNVDFDPPTLTRR